MSSLNWTTLLYSAPNYYFVKKNFKGVGEYEKGFKIDALFLQNNTGLNTEFDELAIQDSKSQTEIVLDVLKNKSENECLNFLNFNQDKLLKIRQAIWILKTIILKLLRLILSHLRKSIAYIPENQMG